MPDYNIYIHNAITSQESSPTKPWSNQTNYSSPLVPWQSQQQKADSQDRGGIYTPNQIFSKGLSEAAKVYPWVAGAMVVIKGAMTIYETALDFKNIRTGDITESIQYNNLKSFISNAFNPMSWLNEYKQSVINSVENDRRRKTLELLGDSTINSYVNRGV